MSASVFFAGRYVCPQGEGWQFHVTAFGLRMGAGWKLSVWTRQRFIWVNRSERQNGRFYQFQIWRLMFGVMVLRKEAAL